MVPHAKPTRGISAFVWRLISVGFVVGGLILCGHAYFGVRQTMPVQAEAVGPSQSPLPVVSVSPAVSPLPVVSASPSASPSATVPAKSPAVQRPKYKVYPRHGDRIGTISLPTLHESWAIFQGTDKGALADGVGHYLRSVLPGQTDNSVLAGHRETVFNRLGHLQVGDLIVVKTVAGTFDYKVRKFRIVKRTDRTVFVPTPTAVLTLVTCYPFNFVGTTNKSFVVVADLVASSK